MNFNKFFLQRSFDVRLSLTQFCVKKPQIFHVELDHLEKALENQVLPKNVDSLVKNRQENHSDVSEILKDSYAETSQKFDEQLPDREPDNEWDEIVVCRRNDELAKLESVLFLAREPLSSRRLAQYTGISSISRIHSLLRELSEHYLHQPCAFFIVEVAGGYQLRTRSQFAPWLLRLQEVPIEIRLSSTALETLAIVAKKQPVLRVTIESIRGVQCGETLRQLLERNLIKIVGRSDELGRPFLYGTTKYFLQIFGLKKIEELLTR